jgi:hypothetical protein
MTREEKYWLVHKIENNILYRLCSKCNEWLPETTEYFYLHNKSKPELGFTSECKSCSIRCSVNWIRNNKDKKREIDKRHNSKPEAKAKHKIILKKQKDNGYYDEYVRKNPEKFRQYAKNHCKHDITENEWKHCKDFFKNKQGELCCATWNAVSNIVITIMVFMVFI